MFKAVVVDDEKIEREGINYLLEKHRIRFNTMFFDDGEAALEHIKTEGTDILFTDIKMPFMGGLELAEAVHKLDSDIKIIIFSAYDEFNFARRAIDLDVTHYLLKPVDEEEFIQVISKITRQLNEGRKRNVMSKKLYRKAVEAGGEYILLNVLRGEPVSYQNKKILKDAGIYFGDYYYTPCFLDFSPGGDARRDSFIEEKMKSVTPRPSNCVRIDEYRSMILIQSSTKISRERLEQIGKTIFTASAAPVNQPLHVIFGEPFLTVQQGRAEYAFMEEISRHNFFFTRNTVIFSNDHRQNPGRPSLTEDIFISINNAVAAGDISVVERHFEALSGETFLSSGITPESLKYHSAESISELFSKAPHILERTAEELIAEIYSAATIDQLKNLIIAGIKKYLVSAEKEPDVPKSIESAIEVIHEQYTQNIGVEYIADAVYLNQNYLSHIFKETMGIGLTKYLTNYRLKKAEELLQTSNLKIGDVAKRTGFNSSSYFCLIFRNHFGISPLEYREKGMRSDKTGSRF